MFVGNEIELGIRIPKIKPRTNKVSLRQRDKDSTFNVQMMKLIRESTGAIMGFQIPLLVIDRRSVSVMSGAFPNRRVSHLRVYGV